MNYWKQSPEYIYVAAHRGWSEKYPENTMAAFRAAVEIGVDQIETDVRITKDGELVLIHDADLDRTTDGSGKVCDFTLAELKKFDAGIKKDEKFKGEQIPTLEEFMDLVRDLPTMTVDIELKEYPVPGREELSYDICRRVLKMIDDYNYTDRCVINTFSGKLHEYIRENYGDKYRQHVYFPIKHLGECKVDPYSYAYCCCMFGGNIMAEKKEFEAMKQRGVQPWAGAGVKDEAGVDLAIYSGAELITCNNPDVILKLLREKGYHQ